MYKLKELIFITLLVIFSGCGGSGGSSTSSSNLVDAEPIVKAVAHMDKLNIDVQKNTYDTTTELLTDVNSMLHSVVDIDDNVTHTMVLNMKLLNALAQPVGITQNYKSLFAIADTYNSTTPAFRIIGTLTKNYFLLSCETPFFIEQKTVKSYFNNSDTLSKAWIKAISTADKSKNLYLSIVEIDEENITHKVSNALLIKSSNFPL